MCAIKDRGLNKVHKCKVYKGRVREIQCCGKSHHSRGQILRLKYLFDTPQIVTVHYIKLYRFQVDKCVNNLTMKAFKLSSHKSNQKNPSSSYSSTVPISLAELEQKKTGSFYGKP